MAKKLLEDKQIEMGIKNPKTLRDDLSTRWNSEFMMLERMLELKSAIVLFLTEYSVSDAPTKTDWDLAESLLEVVRPLYNVTNEVCAEKHTTIGSIIPIVYILLKSYEPIQGGDPIIEKFKLKLYESVEIRLADWIQDNNIYAISCLLDPRFKSKGFFGGEQKVKAAKRMVKKEAKEMGLITETQAPEEKRIENRPATAPKDHWAVWDIEMEASDKIDPYVPRDVLDSELDEFLGEQRIERSKDPLDWWVKIGKNKFPTLFEIAMKFMIVPATSTPSERVFSKAGILLNYLNNRLDPELVNMIITLNRNMSKEDLML